MVMTQPGQASNKKLPALPTTASQASVENISIFRVSHKVTEPLKAAPRYDIDQLVAMADNSEQVILSSMSDLTGNTTSLLRPTASDGQLRRTKSQQLKLGRRQNAHKRSLRGSNVGDATINKNGSMIVDLAKQDIDTFLQCAGPSTRGRGSVSSAISEKSTPDAASTVKTSRDTVAASIPTHHTSTQSVSTASKMDYTETNSIKTDRFSISSDRGLLMASKLDRALSDTMKESKPVADGSYRLIATPQHPEILYTGFDNVFPLSVFLGMDIDELTSVGSSPAVASIAEPAFKISDQPRLSMGNIANTLLALPLMKTRNRASTLAVLNGATSRPKLFPEVKVIGRAFKSSSVGNCFDREITDIDKILMLSDDIKKTSMHDRGVTEAPDVSRPRATPIDVDFLLHVAESSENGSSSYKSILADPQYAVDAKGSYLIHDSDSDSVKSRDIEISTDNSSIRDVPLSAFQDSEPTKKSLDRIDRRSNTVSFVSRPNQDIDEILQQLNQDSADKQHRSTTVPIAMKTRSFRAFSDTSSRDKKSSLKNSASSGRLKNILKESNYIDTSAASSIATRLPTSPLAKNEVVNVESVALQMKTTK